MGRSFVKPKAVGFGEFGITINKFANVFQFRGMHTFGMTVKPG